MPEINELAEFIEQNSTSKQDDCRRLMCNYFERDNSPAYLNRLAFMKLCLSGYRSMAPDNSLRKLVELCCEADARYCKAYGKPEHIRQHNTLVFKYISQNEVTDYRIAAIQHLTVRTVFRDVSNAINRFMIFAFGLDGIKR